MWWSCRWYPLSHHNILHTIKSEKGGIPQRVVDHHGHFVDIYIRCLGRVHYARVFANSTLYERSQNKRSIPDWNGEKDVPILLHGDPAYPAALDFEAFCPLSPQQKRHVS